MKTKFTLPAGTYYIGDPCYVFPNKGPDSEKWDELLEQCDYFTNTCYGEIPNIKVWTKHTPFGDGSYGSNYENKQFFVDSGLIGIVPIETVNYLEVDTDLEVGGLFHTFEEQFVVDFSNPEVFQFGDILIFLECMEDLEDEYEE